LKRFLYLLVSVLALVALGAYAYYANRSGPVRLAVTDQADKSAPGKAVAPLPVEVVKVAVGALQEDLTAVGTLRSNDSVVVRPETTGRIVSLPHPEGTVVQKGALLVALDASTQMAELAQAKAQLALSQSNHERSEELLKKNFISEKARDEALAALRINQANVQLLEARLAKTRIIAPFAGTIGLRQVSVGDYVKEGQDLMTLEDLTALKVDFRVPEHVAARIRVQQVVELSVDAMPDRKFAARLVAVDPVVDQAGRALVLRARMDNAGGGLRPGMFGRVRLILAERSSPLVPEEALVQSGTERFVFRVVDGKAERVAVKTGLRRNAMVEILEGLSRGDLVVTAGQQRLRDGSPVRAQSEAPDS
jgi:membrane fusion protein (multidrug efflux system)